MTPNYGAPRGKVGMLVGFSDSLSFVVAEVRPVFRVRRSAMWVLARGGMWWRTAVAAAFAFIIHAQTCSATTRALVDTRDTVSAQDLLPSGGCESGCVRRVVDAVASVEGGIECELVVQNLLDHTGPDVMGGTLNIVHSCTDADGNLRYQGEGDCLYDVCVLAEWQDGRVYYTITVEHETTGTSKEHSVHLEAYLNEYDHLLEKGSGSTSPTVSNLQCTLGGGCPTVTDCGTDATRITVLMEDDFGDGWVGGLPGRSNSWTITQADGLTDDNLETDTVDGILPDGHFTSTSRVCLENGAYTFESTAIAAWSSESSWTLCGVKGGLGGSMEFQVEGGVCAAVDDSSAGGPTPTDGEVDGDKICSLPEESPCAETKPGIVEISGPSVGMYYDESCLEGGGDVSGCDGGGVSTCRLCFVNQALWKIDFPDERLPDWGACPCCVAEILGVECEGGFAGNITFTSPTLLEEVRDNFTQGKIAAVVGLGVLLGLCWMVACCCVRSILKEQDKALTFKHALASRGSVPVAAVPYHENTSTENSPPFGGGGNKASKAAVGDSSFKVLEAGLAGVDKPPETTRKNRKNRGKMDPPSFGDKNAPAASTAAVTARATPFVEFAPEANLPGISQDRPPSDASWPTDPHDGVSIDGNKHPRWNGSRELRAYLRRTRYDKVEATAITEGDEPAVDTQGRVERDRLACGNGSSVVKAIRGSDNMNGVLADTGHINGRTEGDGRVGDHPEVLGAATAAAAAEHLRVGGSPEHQFNVSLGDLPVPPSPPPKFAPVPEPQCITTLRPGEVEGQRRPRNRSRSRSRSRSRRSGNGIVKIAPSDDTDRGAERNPTKLENMDHKQEQDDFALAYGAPHAAKTPLAPMRSVAPALPSAPQGVGRVEGRREARSSSYSPRVDTDGVLEPQRGASRERREPNGQQRRQKSREPSRQKSAGRGGEDAEFEKKRGGDVAVVPGDAEGGRGRVGGRDRRRAAHQDRHDHGKMERHDGSHARHEDRDANFKDRSEEREGRQESRGRDRKSRTARNDAARHEGNPEGPRRETEAERRRRRARKEAETVGRQQHQQRQTRRGERRPGRSKERSDENGGGEHPREQQQSRRDEDRHDHSDGRAGEPGVDPPAYDPQWSSRERSHNSRMRRENAVESRDILTPQQMEGQPEDSGLSQDMNGGRADAPRAPVSTVPSRTTSVMRFSNDPRARHARESSRRARLEKQEGYLGVDGTGQGVET